jgi:hypothetical protein
MVCSPDIDRHPLVSRGNHAVPLFRECKIHSPLMLMSRKIRAEAHSVGLRTK